MKQPPFSRVKEYECRAWEWDKMEEQGTGNGERGTENRERGIGNGEWNREWGTEEREQ